MAIYKDGVETYKGAVLTEESHMWMDGMEEVYAVVWNGEELERIQVGYFGIDGQNLMGMGWNIDATEETKRAVRKWLKTQAWKAFEKSVLEYKNEIHKGAHVEVVRGRKVKKGTQLEVFWIGEKETYKSRQYSWMYETELIAGCYDADGNKIWIKAEYLKNLDDIKSPKATERNKYIKSYVEKRAKEIGA